MSWVPVVVPRSFIDRCSRCDTFETYSSLTHESVANGRPQLHSSELLPEVSDGVKGFASAVNTIRSTIEVVNRKVPKVRASARPTGVHNDHTASAVMVDPHEATVDDLASACTVSDKAPCFEDQAPQRRILQTCLAVTLQPDNGATYRKLALGQQAAVLGTTKQHTAGSQAVQFIFKHSTPLVIMHIAAKVSLLCLLVCGTALTTAQSDAAAETVQGATSFPFIDTHEYA